MELTSCFHRIVLFTWAWFAIVGSSEPAVAQDSAPSSHLVFDDNFSGDIVVHQVRVPKDGEARFTYYETLGWRGKAAGYAGIQSHPRGRNFIFSIWDHPSHQRGVAVTHRGPGTLTEKFGGEGTGLKSWNFELGWETGTWLTLLSRCWDHETGTYFGFWAYSEKTGLWTHLVTLDVGVKDARFKGGTDAFLEDWLNTGKNVRTVHYRGGWKRKAESGDWVPFRSARYSVNPWDLVKGKRSFNFRNNWNGGVAEDETGKFFFMTAGGKETKPEVANPNMLKLPVEKKANPTGAAFSGRAAEIKRLAAKWLDESKIQVDWKWIRQSTPPFETSVRIRLPDGADEKAIAEIKLQPHQRQAVFDLSKNKAFEKASPSKLEVHVSATDVMGQAGKTQVIQLANPASK